MSCVRRFRSLLKQFNEKRSGKLDDDMFDEYLFHLIVDLRDVYDNNYERLQAAAKRKAQGLASKHDLYAKREKLLNTVGHILRNSIGLLQNDPDPYEKPAPEMRGIHGVCGCDRNGRRASDRPVGYNPHEYGAPSSAAPSAVHERLR